MQNSPLVSVLCLCYNHSQFVIESIQSVLNQTYKNVELLIADDCSTDNSVEVINDWLQSHPNIIFLPNKKNLGNTKTFNQLLKLSKGDFIIDLAADDILNKNCIETQIKQFQNSKFNNLGIVYGNLELIDEHNQHLAYYYDVDLEFKAIKLPPSGNIYTSIISANEKICSVSSLVKRDVLKYTNGYDEKLAYEDLDLWIRASRVYNIEYIDEILVKKRELKNSLYQSFFFKNKKTNTLNHSTYLILKKAFDLNKTKEENNALLKRVHNQMDCSFKVLDLSLLFKLSILKIKIHFKSLFGIN